MAIGRSKISEIRKLHSKKFRDESGKFLVEGYKSVRMLCESDFKTDEIFATEAAFSDNENFLRNEKVTLVSSAEMERISTMQTPPELLAVAFQRTKFPKINDNEPVIVLDRISDPGNLGTIVRTADWFDIRQIVCSEDCVEIYNPKAIQASMGSFLNVFVRKVDIGNFLSEMQKKRRILGTFMQGTDVSTFKFQSSDILLIGNEANGISEGNAEFVSERVTIQRKSKGSNRAESLNAAIATAVILHSWSAAF